MDKIIVRHRLTNEPMTIKKEFGNIVTCHIEKPYYLFNNVLIDTVICLKENLIYER